MRISRRQFNRGALAMAAMTAMPVHFVPAEAGYDEAYTRILSELCRVEEAASIAGHAGSGAMTWQGRQLEFFLGALDLRVSPLETAGQVFSELRDFLSDNARRTAELEDETARKLARQMHSYAESWVEDARHTGAEAEEEPPA